MTKKLIASLLVGAVASMTAMERKGDNDYQQFVGKSASVTINELRRSGELYESPPNTPPQTPMLDLWELAQQSYFTQHRRGNPQPLATNSDPNNGVDLFRLAEERYLQQVRNQNNGNQ